MVFAYELSRCMLLTVCCTDLLSMRRISIARRSRTASQSLKCLLEQRYQNEYDFGRGIRELRVSAVARLEEEENDVVWES